MAEYGTVKYGTAKYGNNGDKDILWLFYRTVNDILNDTDRNYINYIDLNRIESRMQEYLQSREKRRQLITITLMTKCIWSIFRDMDMLMLMKQLKPNGVRWLRST